MDLYPKDAELFVGIVARIGVDTDAIVVSIEKELTKYSYDVSEIHVTDFIQGLTSRLSVVTKPVEQRYESYISACNKLRSDTSTDVMAKLAILNISEKRQSARNGSFEQERRAFIINQIKRPEEFELLRQIYGEQYVQISCHADEQIRIDRLTARIAHDHPENPKSSDWDLAARRLVHSDESQEDQPDGQRVRQVFPLSDLILDANNNNNADRGIERFFRSLFGDKSVTPTREEYGMELANTASQRSSDSSRQVGAAILNHHMEVQALGCNEVPKATGGTYWEKDSVDGRDFSIGYDSNDERRRAVLLDLLFRLQKGGALASHLSTQSDIENFLFDRDDTVISDSQMMDSLEYGRTVHAEMNAITDAARGGHAIRDCLLFTNTFPCHNCAKHIVASGITEVIYIHPYPKSYAKELFPDSIVINPIGTAVGVGNAAAKVVFRQFVGVLGPMFARLFTKTRWKRSGGKIPPFEKEDAFYIRRTPIPAYRRIEELILDDLKAMLQSKGFLSE